MRILDWRTPAEKLLQSLWRPERSGVRPPGSAARLYQGIHRRVMARRVDGRPAPMPEVPVVSIGNLALGGTGKTPVAGAVARDLAERGVRGVILTRGFRSPLAGPLRVTADNARAGDEARTLAGSLAATGWQVIQSRDRRAGLHHALGLPWRPQVILLEDGHQTAGVGRDLDVVILDHWTCEHTAAGSHVRPATGAVFPFGPWRESAAGADRAAVWLVETNDRLPALGSNGRSRVLTFHRETSLRGANETAQNALPVRPALLSGIARPAPFEAAASGLLAASPVLTIRLADHEPYGRPLVERIRRAMAAAGCGALVTTGKDWIKLAPLWAAEMPAHIVDLEIVWGDGETLPDLVGERL